MCSPSKSVNIVGPVLAVLALASLQFLLACERPSDDADANRGSSHSPRYYTVAQQIRIEQAANRLWNGVDLNQSWYDAVTKMFDACGGSMRYDEVFLLGSHHPRAARTSAWRSELEAAAIPRCHATWNPSPDPICKLIVNAVASSRTTWDEEDLAKMEDL